MNEEELKKIWEADQSAPTIDFAMLQKLSTAWHDKLRRKVRVDIWVQSITAGLTLIPVFFYPRMIFAVVLVVVLGIWYVRELRVLYKREGTDTDQIAVKDSLKAKILTMKNYFRRTRFVVYVLCPVIVPAAFYGMGFFDKPGVALTDWAFWMIKILAIYETGVIVGTEIYFKIIYTPALNDLKTLLRQLDSDEITTPNVATN